MIEITLHSNAQQIAASIESFRVRGIGVAMAAAMKTENQHAIARITRERLSGKGPFPPSEHRLGVRTNLLRKSLAASEPVVADAGVSSVIGTPVFYAAFHEFGAEFPRKKKSGVVRLKADARGNLIRRGNLATFARKTQKRVVEKQFVYRSERIRFPERAPIRTGLADHEPQYAAALSQAVVQAWNKEEPK
jgi:hypothetical protein